VVVCAAVSLGLCLAAFIFYWAVLNYRFYTLAEGQIYRSGAMPATVLLKKIKKYNIRTVIDFRKSGDDVASEKDTLDNTDVRYINLPSKQVPSNENIAKFLAILDHQDNRPILMHCHHGVGRAGAFSAIYRMEYEKWNNDRAIREARWLSGFGSFQKGSRKEVFLRNYIPRWKKSR